MGRTIKAPEALRPHRFCPGCGHGVIARVLMEVIESRGLTVYEAPFPIEPLIEKIKSEKLWEVDKWRYPTKS